MAPDHLPAEGAEASPAARTLYGAMTTMETSLTVQVGEPVVVLSFANTVKVYVLPAVRPLTTQLWLSESSALLDELWIDWLSVAGAPGAVSP